MFDFKIAEIEGCYLVQGYDSSGSGIGSSIVFIPMILLTSIRRNNSIQAMRLLRRLVVNIGISLSLLFLKYHLKKLTISVIV